MGNRRSCGTVVPVAAAALLAAGCHGAGADKAGGARPTVKPPTTALTLLTGDALWAPEYAGAVERLSHGTMRIDVTVAGNRPDYEARTVDSVRAGEWDLGAVGARVWDAFGVTSFRALVAPFFVRSLALEQRVLTSPLAARMLAGLNRAGVVGLAVLPGPLRRPLGLSRALAGPSDYRGATIAIRKGGVARGTFRALGARVRAYVIGHLPALDGAELDLNTIAENGYDAKAHALTANVVYWPRPQTIFANQASFARLTSAQQQILRRAGRVALAPELARVEKDEAVALAGICGRAIAKLLTASASQLAALRRAVQPVYADLQRDPSTRELLGAIGRLGRTSSRNTTDTVRCPASKGNARRASVLAGVWAADPSTQELLSAGVEPGEAERQQGPVTLDLHDGRWIGREERSGFVWKGSYSVQGNVLRLVSDTCPRDLPCAHLPITAFAWSVYDDRLTLALVSGTLRYYGLVVNPLTRAG